MKKCVWIALASFILGLVVAGYVFVYLPERHPAAPAAAVSASTPRPVDESVRLAGPRDPAGPRFRRDRGEGRPGRRQDRSEEKVEGPGIGRLTRTVPFDDFWDRFFGSPGPRQPQEVPESPSRGRASSSPQTAIS